MEGLFLILAHVLMKKLYTYRILKHMVEKEVSVTSISRAYDHSTKYQDMVKGFGNRVVLPFVNHIESYLTDIAIDMGFDEEANYMITVGTLALVRA